MNSQIDELYNPYEGKNAAHMAFRQEFKYLNALYYLILAGSEKLQDMLREKIADTKQRLECQHGKEYALCVVTHVINDKKFEPVCISGQDAEVMQSEFNGFIELTNRHIAIASHRLIIDYVNSLIIEVIGLHPNIIPLQDVEKIKNRRVNASDLTKILANRLQESIATDALVITRLKLLGETRNIFEHNNGKATRAYIKLLDESQVRIGDAIDVSKRDVGKMLSLIQYVASDLNQRVFKRYLEKS